MSHLGNQKSLANEAKLTLLDILVYDDEGKDIEDAKTTSATITDNLLATWLAKADKASSTDFDVEAEFIEGQVQLILLSFGKKRPKVYVLLL